MDELKANQFSTTTCLRGEVIFAVTDVFGGDNADVGESNHTILGDRPRLDFDTSFTGDEVLHTRLQAGDWNAFNNIPIPDGIPKAINDDQTDLSIDDNTDDDIVLDAFFYSSPWAEPSLITSAFRTS